MFSDHSVTPSVASRSRSRVVAGIASLFVLAFGAVVAFPTASSAAQAPIDLGTATSFAVLAGEGITNANATTITGDVGTFPNPAETGFDTVTLIGTNHHGDAVTQQAKDDLVTAYNQAAGAGPPTSVAVELGGTTLKPGVYNGATLEITGTLTLDAEGNPNAVFVFQSGSTLITAAGSDVRVLNGGTTCNVFWVVPSSATLGTDSHLIGTVLASTAISAASGATIQGRLLAQTASVTLDHNTITATSCATGGGGGGPDSTDTSATGGSAGTGTTVPPWTGPTPEERFRSARGIPTVTLTPTRVAGPPAPTPEQTLGGASSVPTATLTPAATTPAAPASPPAGSAPPVNGRPPLADTGLGDWLGMTGALAVALGLSLLRLAGSRRRFPTA